MINKVLCLGFFDCVHLGHRKLISEGMDIAKKTNSKLEVVTFDDNFFTARNRGERLIYTATERKQLLLEIGVDSVHVVESSSKLFSMSGDMFLESILNDSIVQVVVGRDYKYGKNAEGSSASLVEFCKARNIAVKVVDLVELGLQKVASTDIRKFVKNGDISGANSLLGGGYFMSGEVEHGKGNGSKFDIPTANLAYSGHKLLPKQGVYKTKIKIEDKIYAALTNVGTQPTFAGSTVTVETLILGYNGADIYGKNITVVFDRRLRGIKKFNSPTELVEQIQKDISEAESND